MRKKIIAGNWKMNMTPSEAKDYLEKVKNSITGASCEVVFCVPYVSITSAVDVVCGTDIKIGAQNMHYLDNGAYTGEISANMLLECGVQYVIIGHSERRMYYNETDELVNKKIIKALSCAISPIVCVGETLEQRENNIEKDIINYQIQKAFEGIAKEDAIKLAVAYEPIWAIGTGKTATDDQANQMCAYIREVLNNKYGAASQDISILYGGSVNDANISNLMKCSDIDGALVGGASLKESFIKIVKYES